MKQDSYNSPLLSCYASEQTYSGARNSMNTLNEHNKTLRDNPEAGNISWTNSCLLRKGSISSTRILLLMKIQGWERVLQVLHGTCPNISSSEEQKISIPGDEIEFSRFIYQSQLLSGWSIQGWHLPLLTSSTSPPPLHFLDLTWAAFTCPSGPSNP